MGETKRTHLFLVGVSTAFARFIKRVTPALVMSRLVPSLTRRSNHFLTGVHIPK